MSFLIDNRYFDVMQGEIILPRRSTERFASPSAPHAGLQVLPTMGPTFSLELTRFNAKNLLQAEIDAGNALIGALVRFTFNGVVYDRLPYRCRFAVLAFQPTRTDTLLMAAGSRNGVAFKFEPACIVVGSYTFQAVPQ